MILGIIVFLIMECPIILGVLAAILAIVFIVGIVLGAKGGSVSSPPRRRRRSYRSVRKSKSFVRIMLDGQKRTQKRNASHRGVMCGPGGVGLRGGKRRKHF